MSTHPKSSLAIGDLWLHRALLIEMTKRDILGRYRGSMLGIFWSLIQPLLMLAIYTFVFTQVFNARWHGSQSGNELAYALNLFSGLIVFNIFGECINRAPGTILANANFVTKVVFPLQILPCVHLLTSLFHAALGLLILSFVQLLVLGKIPLTIFLLPIQLLPLLLFILGLSWLLAATGVYWRDISQVIGLFVTGLLFISPVFFPSNALPERWRLLTTLNPLSIPIEESRSLILLGELPDIGPWLIYLAFALCTAWIGFYCFQQLRKGFADVL